MFKKNNNIKEDIYNQQEYFLNLEIDKEKILFYKSRSHINIIGLLLITCFYIMFELTKLNKAQVLIIAFSLILIIILIISLFFSIKSERIHKIDYNISPDTLINNNINMKNIELREIQKRLAKHNKKRRKDLVVSSIFLYIFLCLFLIFGLITIIVII